MAKPFDQYNDVLKVVARYIGGHEKDPTYEQVCSDTTGHIEVVQITYDDSIINYGDFLDIFWKQIYLTDIGGQFNDRGYKYKTAIFYHDENQRKVAGKSKEDLENSNKYDKEDLKNRLTPLQYSMVCRC